MSTKLQIRNIYTVDLLKSMFFSRPQAIEFDSYLMNSSYVFKKDSLMSRAHTVCLVKMYLFPISAI